jgi:hypothetical protein
MATTNIALGYVASIAYIHQCLGTANAPAEKIANWFDGIADFHGFPSVRLCVHKSSAFVDLAEEVPSLQRMERWLDEAWARTEAALEGEEYVDRPEDDATECEDDDET